MQSSLLDRIFPPSSPLLPQHDYRQGTRPSQPAPISASAIHHADPLLPVERAANSLQRTIQSLLDAQSEGLLAGLSSTNGEDDISSNGSLTPTPTMSSTITRKSATMPIRQPIPKKISLRGARRGLSRSMHEFALLKQEEGRIIDTQIEEREEALGSVDAFTSKRNGLQSEIASISKEDPVQSADRLRSQATQLDAQIRQLEDKLFEMKAQHRQLVDQAEQLESSVQSKLSSYKASLDLLDQVIKRFLARPPIQQPSSTTAVLQTDSREDTATRSPESFYALKTSRRTLEMASEHWQSERAALQNRKSSIAHEQAALEAGGKIWREVVHQIQTFERRLHTQMQRLSSNPLSRHERDEGMVKVLGEMDRTMEVLEHRLKEAEEKDWKLLLCCIGAEVEACKEGRAMLVEALGMAESEHGDKEAQNGLLVDDDAEEATVSAEPHSPDAAPMCQPVASSAAAAAAAGEHVLDDWGDPATTGSTILSRPEGAAELGSSSNNADSVLAPTPVPGLAQTRRADSRSESEDDDPGPDFLISHT